MNETVTETDAIKDQLRAYIRRRCGVAEGDADFTDEVHLYEYGYIDSFGALELRLFIESQFSIKVTTSDLTTLPLNTIQQIARFIAQRRADEI